MHSKTSGNIWERIGRPTPEFVSGLPSKDELTGDKEKENFALAHRFGEMLRRKSNGEERQTGDCELGDLMKQLRQLLSGASDKNADDNTAFPLILLGRLPSEMIDIGLMLVGLDSLKTIAPKEAKRAFCLWCLTFGDAAKAANALAEQAIGDTRPLGYDILRAVIKKLEDEGKASVAPTLEDIRDLRKAVPSSRYDDGDTGPLLQSWGERFKAEGIDPRISNTINDMRFWSTHGKNALLWLQRNYLRKHFPDFDPTSDRDEDLPIDLDHIVPSERFYFHWQEGGFPLGQNRERLNHRENTEVLNNLRSYRDEIGNLLAICAGYRRRKTEAVAPTGTVKASIRSKEMTISS